MDIRYNEEAHRFDMYAEDGTHVGEIEYKPSGTGEWYATHTEVFPGNEGKGYAGLLLDALVQKAMEEGRKIVPVCPYVIGAFRKYPEKYADVIK